jgi:hypothetical protein
MERMDGGDTKCHRSMTWPSKLGKPLLRCVLTVSTDWGRNHYAMHAENHSSREVYGDSKGPESKPAPLITESLPTLRE